MSNFLAKVVRVNSSGRGLDLVRTDNNEPIYDVKTLGKASSVSGEWDVPNIPKPTAQQQAGIVPNTGRSMLAVVGYIGRRAIIHGFIPDYNNEVAFTDPDRAVSLHASGLTMSKDQYGNLQINHPGGAVVRIGSAAVENLADVAVGGAFPVPQQSEPTITVQTAKFTLTIDPAGDLAITTMGNATVQANNATVTATTAATITAPQVNLGAAAGGKRVVVDGDPVVGNRVQALQNTHVFAL